MPLSDSDIIEISRLGFKNFFKVNKNGLKKLRNFDGRCIFHNGKICKIYSSRPTGCRLYPAVFDGFDSKVILDNHCPYKENFVLTSRITQEVIRLLKELDENKGKYDIYF